jgi:hypothetical protein
MKLVVIFCLHTMLCIFCSRYILESFCRSGLAPIHAVVGIYDIQTLTRYCSRWPGVEIFFNQHPFLTKYLRIISCGRFFSQIKVILGNFHLNNKSKQQFLLGSLCIPNLPLSYWSPGSQLKPMVVQKQHFVIQLHVG